MASSDCGFPCERLLIAQPDGVTYQGFAYPGSLVVLPSGKLLMVCTGHRKDAANHAVAFHSTDEGRSWSGPARLFGGDELSDTTSDLDESYADPNVVIVSEQRVMVFCVSLRFDNNVWDLSRTRFWRRVSDDGGLTFGPVEELPRHRKYYVGTVHPGLRLSNGTLAMGYSWDGTAEKGRSADGEGTMDLYSGVLLSHDEGLSWQPGGDAHVDIRKAEGALSHATNGLDEPAVVELPNGDLFMLGRTGTPRLWQSFSHDHGLTWEAPTLSSLVSHNCPAALLRLVGEEAVVVAYNDHPQQRARMSVAVSSDGCRSWSEPRVVGPIGHPETPEASYPALCQLPNGDLLLVFGQIDREEPGARFAIRGVRLKRATLPSA